MGTRAAFFVGDIRDLEKREWLGCIAWDGYLEGVSEIILARSEEEYREAIKKYSSRDDFATPDGPFPFPWMDDLCITDFTYTWMDEKLWLEYDRRLIPLDVYQKLDEIVQDDEMYNTHFEKFQSEVFDKYPRDLVNIPAPGKKYDGTAPDSIIIISRR